ncbi:ABC transporter ATP-binding protein [bacterium 1xD8-48]|nr:ABC transporter ATP-binding protein [bacterium 1xD8-48]
MSELKKLKDLLHKMNYILSSRHKRYAVAIFFMGILAAMLELLGVAVIIPILDILLDVSSVENKWYMGPFIQLLNLNTETRLIYFICIMTIFIYIVKNAYFIFYHWVTIKFAYKVRRELSTRVLSAYMQQGYIFFVEHNTSGLLQGINGDIVGIYSILSVIFSMVAKLATVIAISVFIVYQSKQMAVILILFSVLSILVVQLIYRKNMHKNGARRRELSCDCTQTAMEAIQGNKAILVMNKQGFFAKHYSKVSVEFSKIATKVELGTISPVYIIEAMCICGVLLAVLVEMGIASDTGKLIEQLSTIAVGAFRILPSLGAISSGMNTITMNIPLMEKTYQILNEVSELEKAEKGKKITESKYKDIEFKQGIKVDNISFCYPNSEENVLEDASVIIKKGESVAFIGPSGAGKTTLSDIILALLKPSKGKILMDGIDIEELGGTWNRIIGYVPQTVYIVDDSIRNNIAFGEEKGTIDDKNVWQALKVAQLDEFVRGLPRGIDTRVGEFGVRFSGGQRQRLAIARAMYHNPEILVLDEATAALDNETENEVMKAIEALQGYKTLIVVAHRLTTVKKCDEIYEVRDKKIIKRNKADVLKGI